MPRKTLKRAVLKLQILKFSGGGLPPDPLAARAFSARDFPRLVLKPGYGPALTRAVKNLSINPATSTETGGTSNTGSAGTEVDTKFPLAAEGAGSQARAHSLAL